MHCLSNCLAIYYSAIKEKNMNRLIFAGVNDPSSMCMLIYNVLHKICGECFNVVGAKSNTIFLVSFVLTFGIALI